MAKQNFVGLVVSQGKMNKTVKVRVLGKVYDRRVDKEIVRRKDYLVHDQGNICKEGDVVRIESIPKLSKRKAFAIAEIKENRGQQFAEYEDIAKRRIQEEDEAEARKFLELRKQFLNLITQLEDLKRLDELNFLLQNELDLENDDKKHESLINEVKSIREKYGIKSWPTTEPVVDLELNKPIWETETQRRTYFIKHILDELMNKEMYKEFKEKVLQSYFKDKPIEEVSKAIQKNVLRKYVLDEKNEIPVQFPAN
ncbi:conserved hypothetical protein [Lodderomyces elongisporus NRRL YB-4239]|uniref:Uncharacterized protein n=1 Tax=Lodderomyces elongisporus (strain ATCC 11503 / CBS 2605 / JCM 1781 / NBRC 1676 / NRRL YB-4239) TaxID=379508 RepID=A5E3V7_LODEL|nr:conserved hypothetical protein [Lodderomyces elongisporus NRRL YB-4239]